MPDNGPEKKNDWLSKIVPGTTDVSPYEHADRAAQVYSQYVVGYDEEDIAAFFGVSVIDVKRDLQYIQSGLSTRQVISMENDRIRIRIQRDEARNYKRILNESLTIQAKEYLAAGMSPVSAMKEFREAVSMTEKPGGLSISFTKNTANINTPGGGIHPANISGRNGIKSYEDLVRMIIEQDPSCGLQPIEADAQEIIPPDKLDDVIGSEDSEGVEESFDDAEYETT